MLKCTTYPPCVDRTDNSVSYLLVSFWRSAKDACRAFAMSPHLFKRDSKDRKKIVEWRWYEISIIKMLQFCKVFRHSFRTRIARRLIVPRFETEGLLANLLHVIEVLNRVRPDASVHIDWILTGTETGFRYGKIGEDVWSQLFGSLGLHSHKRSLIANFPIDNAFWGNGKARLRGNALQHHRSIYHQTFTSCLEITNGRVREEVDRLYERRLRDCFCVGVHKRVGNWMVASCQHDGMVSPTEHFIECVRSQIQRSGATEWVVYLATDDSDAVPIFENAFKERLIVRENVKRTTYNQAEVHFQGDLSINEAEDVLIDTVLLARCSVLVHASSSISTVASILNPQLLLCHV